MNFFKTTISTILFSVILMFIITSTSYTQKTSLIPKFNENAVVKIFCYENLEVNSTGTFLNYVYWADPRLSHGSGVLISNNGIIITAKHVVEKARFISVRLPGNTLSYPAEVIPSSDYSDYAFIVIKGTFNNFVPLPQKAPSLQRGQTIWTYGYPIIPGEIEPNITKGIITRFSNFFNKWQLDATVHPGSSGGPLVTDNGEIAGVIVSQLKDAAGLNFALAIDTIIINYRNLSQAGIFDLTRKKLDNMSPEHYMARANLAKFFAQILLQNKDYIPLKDFEILKNEFSTISDTNRLQKEWAIYKEICASFFFDQASLILEQNKKTMYTAKDMEKDNLSNYIYWLKKAQNESDIAKKLDKNSTEALEDVDYYIETALSKVSSSGSVSSGGWGDTEPDVLWSDSDIADLKGFIGKSKYEFKQEWGSNPKEENLSGINYLLYNNLMVGLDSRNYVISISFYCEHVEKVNLRTLKNINPSDKKSAVISKLGSNYQYKSGSSDNIKELYTWSLDYATDMMIAFNNYGEMVTISMIKKTN